MHGRAHHEGLLTIQEGTEGVAGGEEPPISLRPQETGHEETRAI